MNLNYDLAGNLIIIIPKADIQNTEPQLLLKSLEKLIGSSTKEINNLTGRAGDPALEVVGLGKSETTDGAVNHDKHIYGLA